MSRAYVSEGHWSRPSLAPSRSQIVPPVVMLFHLPVKSTDVTQGSADVEPPLHSRGGGGDVIPGDSAALHGLGWVIRPGLGHHFGFF
jgi:hypothetical protein